MKNKTITTVELFAGIGGFRLACDRLGIQTIWANDINELAATVYRDRFRETEFVRGDIQSFKHLVPNHNLLTAGFPCQPFSSAGKKQGITDPKGTLFATIVEILHEKQPQFFVLENVKRLLSMDAGRHFGTILHALTELGYFLEWRLLNAMHFGLPQYRERTIIVGTKKSFTPSCYLATDEDLCTVSDRILSEITQFQNWWPITKHGKKFPTWGLAYQKKFYGITFKDFQNRFPTKRLKDVLQKDVDARFDFTEDTQKRLLQSTKVNRFYNSVEIIYNQKGGSRMGYTVFGIHGVAPTLTSTTSRHYERYSINGRFRRLTDVEYARIQGFPDHHCHLAPLYDRYALYGNAVPPAMVYWVIDRIINQKITKIESNFPVQMALFG
ncbi:DNA (cytosine-5-)-methyltransferase [Geitlerinema sp. PCC 9228]|uniref:DNA cytosine methyltransferase n=1 Tax=Geitlerinema sp. PCC 9228 TaxID=111611 RepID=UPI0008F9DE2C|nr:DNA (cytosine-5-)-methyltransferase [Geitlerinema sp. PCC 9228]